MTAAVVSSVRLLVVVVAAATTIGKTKYEMKLCLCLRQKSVSQNLVVGHSSTKLCIYC